MGHEKITTTLQLYTRRTDNESRILDALTDEPGEGTILMTTMGYPEYRPRIADYLLTLGPSVIGQLDSLRWWAILGLNQ